MGLRLMNPRFHEGMPGYSPDGGAAIWGWAREGHRVLGTKVKGENFLCGLSIRKDEVKGRCRTVLQSKAKDFCENSPHRCIVNAHPTLALV